VFRGYKVVCVTPAGRQRYLRVLVPYILNNGIVDEYQLWNNTTVESDIQYLHDLEREFPQVRIVEPDRIAPGSYTAIGQFFRGCIDAQSIYIRFDDDIVYMEPLFFETFLRFRIENPSYFLLFPNIINNPICTYIQVMRGTIDPGIRVHPWSFDLTTWRNAHFAESIHRAFLESLFSNTITRWHFPPQLLAFSRFPVNCMCWFGRDFASFGGEVGQEEEELLSVIIPSKLMRANCVYGEAIVSHFAYYPQRTYLDSTDLLDCYEALSGGQHDRFLRRNDSVSSEDVCTPRLLKVIRTLMTASIDELLSPNYVANQIRFAARGFEDGSHDNRYTNSGHDGLSAISLQLANCLIHLSKKSISDVIEIGTGPGWTTCFLTAYLARFNDAVQVTTVDLVDSFKLYQAVKGTLPIKFHKGKSSLDYKGEVFDLAVIGGDHAYDNCLISFENVGRYASICMVQDINDRFIAHSRVYGGGVPRLWAELKSRLVASSRIVEFLDHPRNEKLMGIGLIIRNDVAT
jgi:hypothetical protein